jgi:hypothetical protein
VTTAANLFKVPKKLWRQWDKPGRRVFNEVYNRVRHNPEIWTHPDIYLHVRGRERTKQWAVTAWNVAWAAAEATQRAIK